MFDCDKLTELKAILRPVIDHSHTAWHLHSYKALIIHYTGCRVCSESYKHNRFNLL